MLLCDNWDNAFTQKYIFVILLWKENYIEIYIVYRNTS